MTASSRRPGLRILQVATVDEGGGAATVASSLMRGYRSRECSVRQVVGRKHGADPDVSLLPDDRRSAYRLSGYAALEAGLRRLAGRHPNSGWGLMSRSLRMLTHPRSIGHWWSGIEDFEFPGAHTLLDGPHAVPDIVHCHNLHGGFFDLRALARLSTRTPTVCTLHDMWLLTGHCAYSLGCDRWKTGCGECPDLTLYPAVRRDATAANWRRKQAVYAESHLYIATPSRWLLDKVQQSMLVPAIRDARVIHNGVNLSVFHPADRRVARAALDIPQDSLVVLLTTGSKGSMWKDDAAIVATARRITSRMHDATLLFIAVGRETAVPKNSRVPTRSVPFQDDPRVMAKYYQAADVYLHAAKADNFPTSVLEALACGTPVVATRIGGIPEQIRSTSISAIGSGIPEAVGNATGVLVAARDYEGFADAVQALLTQPTTRAWMGDQAARDAQARFDLNQQIDLYLEWFHQIIDGRKAVPDNNACAAQA